MEKGEVDRRYLKDFVPIAAADCRAFAARCYAAAEQSVAPA
jgi:hypothetical protein